MLTKLTIAILLASSYVIQFVKGECANACNGHGKCTSYDMCICNRNWQANDCSERVCQYGLAHVDTPKGDLDMDGSVTSPPNIVAENSFKYPYGTTEKFPLMEDSDLNILTNTAHYYMECSNKGTCDRSTGECACYDGYDGASCQRASCPGYPASCSGHGVCRTISQLAAADDGNIYKLWDKDSTMGCKCDAGYYGPDCSLRRCKSGIDPLYLDDASTVKYSIFDFATVTTKTEALGNSAPIFTDGLSASGKGYWAIRFYDIYGEDWLTAPIVAGASCATVIKALEAIPNDVIPPGQTWCSMNAETTAVSSNLAGGAWDYMDANPPAGSDHPQSIVYRAAFWETQPFAPLSNIVNDGSPTRSATGGFPSSYDTPALVPVAGYVYRIKFFGNPGALKQPKIEIYLDGKRPSLATPDSGSVKNNVITKVWTDGQQGESYDYFADHCDGAAVKVSNTGSGNAKSKLVMVDGQGNTGTMAKKLKACLGASDFDSSNNVIADVYNWDFGSVTYPHLIKLVRSQTTYTDGGYYVALIYDGTDFILLTPFAPLDNMATDVFEVYTTQGTLAMTSNYTEALFGFGSQEIILTGGTSNTFATLAENYDTDPNHGATNLPGTRSEYAGGISCETEYNLKYRAKLRGDYNWETQYIQYCLNKTDIFTVLNVDDYNANPPHINLYTASKLYTKSYEWSVQDIWGSANALSLATAAAGSPDNPDSVMGLHEATIGTKILQSNLGMNWASSAAGQSALTGSIKHPVFRVYKFFPAVASTYNLVNECSNRGICQTDTGLCQCFPGYSSDDCHEQNSLAV